jgi:hypothetical protein
MRDSSNISNDCDLVDDSSGFTVPYNSVLVYSLIGNELS